MFFSPYKRALLVKDSKKFQNLMNIDLNHYNLLSMIEKNLLEQMNMSAYYDYYKDMFSSIEENIIECYLLHGLKQFSKTHTIMIDKYFLW